MKSDDIDFLLEMGCLRFIDRTWRQFLGTPFANVAEHTLRVAWIALVLAAATDEHVDTAKLLKMAILHDVAESRTGDVNYLQRQYVRREEDLAIRDVFLNTSLEREMLELWNEYTNKSSIEARIVKDADALDVDFELREQAAAGVRLDFSAVRSHVRASVLHTDAAAELWDRIQVSDPHAWHRDGPNRLRVGDWSGQSSAEPTE